MPTTGSTVSDPGDGPRSTDIPAEHGWHRREWWTSVALLPAVAGAWALTTWGRGGRCSNVELAGSFAGSRVRFVDILVNHHPDGRCIESGTGSLRWHLALGSVLAVANAIVLFSICTRWWKRAWSTKRFVSASSLRWLGVVAMAFDLGENAILAFSVRLSSGRENIGWAAAQFLPVVSWIKVLTLAFAIVVAIGTLVAAFSRRRLPAVFHDGSHPYDELPVAGLGISCSGGGIRAASIALGVLGVLERTQLVDNGTAVDAVLPTRSSDSVLMRANYLASVSGGGYSAGAWRAATLDTPPDALDPVTGALRWPQGVIGDPLAYSWPAPTAADSEVGPGPPSLFRSLQQRRQFLRTGRGGTSSSVLLTIAFLVWNLLLVAGLVVALSWPIGRLARTWFVFGGPGCKVERLSVDGESYPLTGSQIPKDISLRTDGDLPAAACVRWVRSLEKDPRLTDRKRPKRVQRNVEYLYLIHTDSRTKYFLTTNGAQFPIRPRMWGSAVLLALLGIGCLASCLVQWNTRLRRRVALSGVGLVAAAAVSALLLVVMPWVLDVVFPSLHSNVGLQTFTALTSATGLVGVVLATARKLLRPRLAYLGGALLAVAAIVLGVEVAGEAATGDGPLSFNGRGIFRDPYGGVWFIAALFVGYLVLCPRWWSLHTIYRNRLRAAFITSRSDATAPASLRRRRRVVVDAKGVSTGAIEASGERLWPVRQRSEPLLDAYRNATGPVHLVCCSAARTDPRVTGVKALSFVLAPDNIELHDVGYSATGLTTTTYFADTTSWLRALGRRSSQQAEGTLSAAISVSGAAIAPAMGRMDLGTTNGLFAALNLRLGTWFPNPRYVSAAPNASFPWVRLSYLGKEIMGSFDLSDPHLFVTDGGHRENLGLVELLRRRCRTIICIDASGDSPGSYTTLRQAAELARVEVGAMIDLSQLPKATASRSLRAHIILPVEYRNAAGESIGSGTVVHIASVVFDELPDDLIAYSLQDPRFPHYSTGDQFLTEEQFRRLVLFGRAAAETAVVRDPEVRAAVATAIRPAEAASESNG